VYRKNSQGAAEPRVQSRECELCCRQELDFSLKWHGSCRLKRLTNQLLPVKLGLIRERNTCEIKYPHLLVSDVKFQKFSILHSSRWTQQSKALGALGAGLLQ